MVEKDIVFSLLVFQGTERCNDKKAVKKQKRRMPRTVLKQFRWAETDATRQVTRLDARRGGLSQKLGFGTRLEGLNTLIFQSPRAVGLEAQTRRNDAKESWMS